MYRYGDTFGGKDGHRVLQAGILDHAAVLGTTALVDELFVPKRVPFVAEVVGVRQNVGMPTP